jgi:hypothetical protein
MSQQRHGEAGLYPTPGRAPRPSRRPESHPRTLLAITAGSNPTSASCSFRVAWAIRRSGMPRRPVPWPFAEPGAGSGARA